ARPGLRLQHLPPLLEGLPASPLRERRDPGAPPPLAAQCTFPRHPHAPGTPRDPRAPLRVVEQRLAPSPDLPRHAHAMIATLFPAPFLLQAAGGASSPLLPFLFQIAAIFGIFYFLMIRPQQKQRKQHEERLRN